MGECLFTTLYHNICLACTFEHPLSFQKHSTQEIGKFGLISKLWMIKLNYVELFNDFVVGLTSKSKGHYRQNVSDLLDPKSPLHLTADRSLQTGVRDTQTEVKLANARESINESYDKMKRNMALRAEGMNTASTRKNSSTFKPTNY